MSDPSGCQTDLLQVRKIEKSNAVDAVMRQLLELIRHGRLADGQRLPSEHSLAASFGVSRSVVREALGGLRSMGLIVSRTGSGSFVSTGNGFRGPVLLGRYPVEELHEVRTHLEVPAAGVAARRATGNQLRLLQQLMDAMERCDDIREWARIDADFHRALAEATNNKVQTRLVADLQELLVENSQLALAADPGRILRARAEHRRILQAVLARDPARAEKAMSLHLQQVSKLLRRAAGEGTGPAPARRGA